MVQIYACFGWMSCSYYLSSCAENYISSTFSTSTEEFVHSASAASLPTLTFESPSSDVGKSRRRRGYRVMISTIDLDPKPVHRIPTWVMRKEDYLQVRAPVLQPH